MTIKKLFFTSLLITSFLGKAHAQWVVTSLHPSVANYSFALGTSGSNQVGEVNVAGGYRASLWSGSAGSWVNLHPAGASTSQAVSVSGLQQVGWANYSGQYRAGRWGGTANSWISLHPSHVDGVDESLGFGTTGASQVGTALVQGAWHASLWYGSSTSWTDLNPPAASASSSVAVYGGSQVGNSVIGGATRASLWAGSSASWVNLHPNQLSWAVKSEARGVWGTKQVGITSGGTTNRASLWSGTAGSWVNLHPDQIIGVSSSEANAIWGDYQVGSIKIGELNTFHNDHACLWRGSGDSVVDLHSLLPLGFYNSEAYSIATDGNSYNIVGFGDNSLTQTREALLWTFPDRSVSGYMAFQDTVILGSPDTEAIGWTLSNGTNTYSGTVSVFHLGGGAYSFDIPLGTPNGAYLLRFKGGTFLSSAYPMNLNSTNLSQSVSLRNGDIDQDGYVGFDDFDILSANFGNPGNNAPGSADLNNDAFVGFDDFDILSANFGLSDD